MKAKEKLQRIDLGKEKLPKQYYNIIPDLPLPLEPPLNPETMEPISPEALEPLFPKALIRQEVSSERFIEIPGKVREQYIQIGRPRPISRALNLEKHLGLPEKVKIFFKREDLSPVGSHKSNTSLAQAFYAKKEGFEKLTTETGAGQWGSALSLAAAFNEMECEVFMVRSSFEQKPYRKHVMNLFGATVHSSPSEKTGFGKKVRKQFPETPGSLGIAISEAIEVAAQNPKAVYSLGSVLNHVLLHQSVIGLEAMQQMKSVEEEPDSIIGCVGGGSNFAGLAYPFLTEKLKGKRECEFIGVEPDVVPSLTKGRFEYDFGDTAQTTPLLKMYTLGCDFVPEAIHAGGLRYHGDAPSLSLLKHLGCIKAQSFNQKETFEAGRLFAKTEGIIPAPETNFAIKAAMERALKAKKKGEKCCILFNFSGHGLLDLGGYAQNTAFPVKGRYL